MSNTKEITKDKDNLKTMYQNKAEDNQQKNEIAENVHI